MKKPACGRAFGKASFDSRYGSGPLGRILIAVICDPVNLALSDEKDA
jgi:hypothetical protein